MASQIPKRIGKIVEKTSICDDMVAIALASSSSGTFDEGKLTASTHRSPGSSSTSDEESQLPEIVVAAGAGDLDRVKELVRKVPWSERPLILNASAKRIDYERCIPGLNLPRVYHAATPLSQASMKGHEQTVEWLLLQGADPTLEGSPIPGVFVSPLDAAKGGQVDLQLNYFGVLEKAPEIDKNDPRVERILTLEAIPDGNVFDIADMLITKKEEFALCIKLLETALKYWKPCNYSSSRYTAARVESNFYNSCSDLAQLKADIRRCHVDPFFNIDSEELAAKVQILVDMKGCGRVSPSPKRQSKTKPALGKQASVGSVTSIRTDKGKDRKLARPNSPGRGTPKEKSSKPSNGEVKSLDLEQDLSSHSQSERKRSRPPIDHDQDASSHSLSKPRRNKTSTLPSTPGKESPKEKVKTSSGEAKGMDFDQDLSHNSHSERKIKSMHHDTDVSSHSKSRRRRSKTAIHSSRAPMPLEVELSLSERRRSRSSIPLETEISPSERRRNRTSVPLEVEISHTETSCASPIPFEVESSRSQTRIKTSVPSEVELPSSLQGSEAPVSPIPEPPRSHSRPRRRKKLISREADPSRKSFGSESDIPPRIRPEQSVRAKPTGSETDPSHTQPEPRMRRKSITSETDPSHTQPEQRIRRKSITSETDPSHTQPEQRIRRKSITSETDPSHTQPEQRIRRRSMTSETDPSLIQPEQRMSRRSIATETDPSLIQPEQRVRRKSIETNPLQSNSEHRRTRAGKKRIHATDNQTAPITARQPDSVNPNSQLQKSPSKSKIRTRSKLRVRKDDSIKSLESHHEAPAQKGNNDPNGEESKHTNSAVVSSTKHEATNNEDRNDRRQELLSAGPQSMKGSNSSLGALLRRSRCKLDLTATTTTTTSPEEPQPDRSQGWRDVKWRSIPRSLSWNRRRPSEDRRRSESQNDLVSKE